jgi:hypothetical protein
MSFPLPQVKLSHAERLYHSVIFLTILFEDVFIVRILRKIIGNNCLAERAL